MATLATLVTSKTRAASASVLLNGKAWRAILKISRSQTFGSGISTGTVEGRNPPVTPEVGMPISWTWGYGGAPLVAGFTGEVTDIVDKSYPDTWVIQVKDVLWRADRVQQVIATSPLNEITGSAAVRYILNTYGGIPLSRINIPTLSASGSAWSGSEWKLGVLTPVQWGDSDTGTGGTTALRAAQEICGVLGYWLYADYSGIIRAKQMERRPSTSPLRTFQRGVDLLVQGAPERQQNVDGVRNRVVVRGANTGVDGAQIVDEYQTTHPLLPSGVYQELEFSSFLIEYVNASEAGNASATSVAQRLVLVHSRVPNVVRARTKADPRLFVGATLGIIDTGIRYTVAQNFFLYQIDTTLDAKTGDFSDQLVLDGGTGTQGYTTIPNPVASFSWRLVTEGLNGDSVIEVFLDGSGSVSLTGGAITTYAWTTATSVYGSTPNTASGVNAVLIYPGATTSASITLTVTDTTSKTNAITQTIDLTGADTLAPLARIVSAAGGAAWLITQDGGRTWNTETSNGDAIAVGTYGAGIDDRAPGTAPTYGLLATRGASGAGGLRQTLTALATASTNLVSNAAAITSNIWVNEANPARVWFAIADTLYRSTDGGATKTAMVKPASGTNITWIIEDPVVDNSVFCLAGANLYHATDPTSGWTVLYSGPGGSTARQFVRSRDGQVTWVCYTGAPSGEAAQRVETGAVADVAVTAFRTLALDRNASKDAATLYLIGAQASPAIYSVDGLTGLSAFTSSQTFPSGTTVQHMLADPEVDVIYTADFDSVAASQGALRKYFTLSDRLMLWKSLAAGQQGHMLGFGGPNTQVRGTIILLPYAASGAADKIWFGDIATGTWTGKTPPEASKKWYSCRVNPFDTNKLLLFRRPRDADNESAVNNALWYSSDGGDNWTNVWTNIANGTNFDWRNSFVEWSLTDGDEWISGRINTDGYLIRGNLATYTEHLIGSGTHASVGPGLQNEALYITLSSNDQGYMDASNVAHEDGSANLGQGQMRILAGTRQAAHVYVLSNNIIEVTDDYQTGTWTSISSTNAIHSLAILSNGMIIAGNGTNIDIIADAWGTPSITQAAFGIADAISAASSDAQTQAVAVVLRNGSNDGGSATAQPAIRNPDSGAWSLMARPPAATDLANAIEVYTNAI